MKTNRELRKFGLTMAVAFCIFGGLFLWRDKSVWSYLFAVGSLFLFFALISPRTLRPIEWAWMKMAYFLGQIMTRVILTVTFYLVITPVGLLMRIFGKDPLSRRFDRAAQSYWVPVDPEGPTSRSDKPY